MTIDFLFSCLASCWKVLTQRSTDRDSLKHLIGCSSKFSFPDRECRMTGNCNNCQKNSLSINSFRALLVSALLKWMPWLSVKLHLSYSKSFNTMGCSPWRKSLCTTSSHLDTVHLAVPNFVCFSKWVLYT